jgi:dihydroneopterin aldolase
VTADTPPPASPSQPFWDSSSNYQRIALRDITIEMSVGIADWEREPGFRQRVIVNIELFSHKENHGGRGIQSFINYDPIHEFVVNEWPKRPHMDLLEPLAEELVELCLETPTVEACRVSLQKPDVYQDTGAAVVELYRIRSDMGD